MYYGKPETKPFIGSDTMPFDPLELKELLDSAEAQTTDSDKGKRYEEACEYVFSSIPGCIVERNVTGIFHTQQIDLAVGCTGESGGLGLFPRIFLVECKDWDRSVDSTTVGYFMSILQGRAIQLGILVAANGITGNSTDMRNAHALGLQHSSIGLNVLVITTVELRALTTTAELIELLHRRFLRAAASGGIGVP